VRDVLTTLTRKALVVTDHASLEVIRPASPVTDQPLIESMRLLALNVDRLLVDATSRSVLLLSARADDGRSFVSTSLAAALGEICSRVLLVKADPLGSEDGFDSIVSHSSETGWLRVADCGRAGGVAQVDYVAGVSGVIEDGLRQGATVVVDSPACTTSAVAFHLATAVGGVLYLATSKPQNPEIHHDIRAQLDLLQANILGVIFNEV
jgi:hypothetical protein